MPFSLPVLAHTFTNADGTPSSGSIQCSLLGMMTNGPTSIVPAERTANLSASGVLSQALTSNIDPGTVPAAPQNAQWRIDMRILGASVQSYAVTVPPVQDEANGSVLGDGLTVQLSSLTAAAYMVGQSVTGTGIAEGAVVTSINVTSNTVTLSAASTPGTGLALVLGATIDLGALLPTAQQVG
jgi:hypothetical protein